MAYWYGAPGFESHIPLTTSDHEEFLYFRRGEETFCFPELFWPWVNIVPWFNPELGTHDNGRDIVTMFEGKHTVFCCPVAVCLVENQFSHRGLNIFIFFLHVTEAYTFLRSRDVDHAKLKHCCMPSSGSTFCSFVKFEKFYVCFLLSYGAALSRLLLLLNLLPLTPKSCNALFFFTWDWKFWSFVICGWLKRKGKTCDLLIKTSTHSTCKLPKLYTQNVDVGDL